MNQINLYIQATLKLQKTRRSSKKISFEQGFEIS